MKIAILSRGSQNHSTQRLVEAALAAGHTPKVLDPFGFYLHIGGKGKRIHYEDTPAEDFDVVLARLSLVTARYGEEVVAHFEWIGVPVINRSRSIANARHKFRSLRILAQHGVPVPPSFTVGSARFLDRAVRETGEYPFIMKPFEGTHGRAILLLDTPTSLRSAVDAMCDLYQDYVIQPFITQPYATEPVGNDVRVIVVGRKAIAAMKRIAQEGEFRSNIHRGGQGHPVDLQGEYIDTAIRAAEVMELEVAGVDLLPTPEGPVVLEVNPSPGLEEIEAVTGGKVAEAIIAFAAEYCQNLKRET
jgi:ribosomal protein S6--L-glutamate ligase